MEQIFEKLQADVLRAVQQIYSEAQFSLIRKPAYWWHGFEQVMAVGMVVFFAFLDSIAVAITDSLSFSGNKYRHNLACTFD